MSLTSLTHTSVFLALSSVVSAIPSSRVLRDTCKCPDDCEEETSHPGCFGTPKPNDPCRKEQCLAAPEAMASTDEQDSMEELEDSVHSLRVMVAALLAIVLILLVAVVLILLKLYLPSFFKCFKKRSDPERRPSTTQKLRQRPTSTQKLRELSISTIRLANHQQSDESPRPARISRNVPHSTPVTEENKQQAAPPKKLVTRQPSESTCPDESSDTHQGYDNLGLSTSTLHNQSTSTSTLHNQSTSSSNRSLGGVNNSTRTLNTILPPDNSPNETLSTRI